MISNAVGLTGLEYLAVVTSEVQVSFVWFFGGGRVDGVEGCLSMAF